FDADTGRFFDNVIEGLEVLDVHRRNDIDASLQQLLDIFIALAVSTLRSVGVRKFIYQHDGRFAAQHRIYIHFAESDSVILGNQWRYDFQIPDLRCGLRAIMRFDIADDHVDSLAT